MISWIRKWRRQWLAARPFPQGWLAHLRAHVRFYDQLDSSLQKRFREMLQVFVWQKHFIGANGMQITEDVKVVIAAAAVRLVLHLDLSYYDRLTEIVVYPSHFRRPDDDRETLTLGEAHSWGTVVLSWEAVLHGLANPHDGHDTATHEFAHVLDRGGGDFDGTPKLREYSHYWPWAQVMSHHFLRLRAGKSTEAKALRSYGAKNEAEFFAVATEAFFEKPRQLQERTPELYQELVRFYGFDPASPHENLWSGKPP